MQPTPSGPGGTFRIVAVSSVDVALPDQYPVVTLEDTEVLGRTLSFRIGLSEGVALSHALAGTEAPRPLTHDLFAAALQRYAIDVLAVRLIGRVGATYLAELDLLCGQGREVLSCRPSDGICLALRQRVPAPLLAEDRLFTEQGDVLPREPADDPNEPVANAHEQVADPHEPADDPYEPVDDLLVAAAEDPAATAPEPAEAGA